MSENKKPTYTTLTHNSTKSKNHASVVTYYKKKYEDWPKDSKFSSISR